MVLGFCRATLPFSLLIAVVLAPSMLLAPREVARVARLMWDDPL